MRLYRMAKELEYLKQFLKTRNKQICRTNWILTKMQNQLNAGKIAFSTNGVEAIGLR